MKQFYTFLESFNNEKNYELINIIKYGFNEIFESFNDHALIIKSTINYLLNNYNINNINNNITLISNTPELGLITINIFPNKPKQTHIMAYAYGSNLIHLHDSTLYFSIAIYNDKNKFHSLLTNNEFKSVITHEVAHLYEFKIRGENNVQDQFDNMSDKSKDKYFNTDIGHYNHKIEKFPIANELITNDKKSLNDYMNDPKVKHLNHRNKNKLRKNISNYIINNDN